MAVPEFGVQSHAVMWVGFNEPFEQWVADMERFSGGGLIENAEGRSAIAFVFCQGLLQPLSCAERFFEVGYGICRGALSPSVATHFDQLRSHDKQRWKADDSVFITKQPVESLLLFATYSGGIVLSGIYYLPFGYECDITTA